MRLLFSRRQEKLAQSNVSAVTRQSTGKLPPARATATAASAAEPATTSATPTTSNNTATTSNAKSFVGQKATPEEIKEKMEQQLRLQRAAHHQKRALEMQKNNAGN